MKEWLEKKTPPTPEQAAQEKSVQRLLQKALETLGPEERDALLQGGGIGDLHAEEKKYSPQVYEKAVAKIRRYFKDAGVTFNDTMVDGL